MEFKDVIVTQIKQEGDEGIVEGFAAIMGNVDHQGDRIHPGAFTQTLNNPPDGMPQLFGWQHNLDHPFGRTISLAEVGADELPPEILKRAPDATGGLKFKARIALSSSQNQERLALMKDQTQVMKGSSIGFDTIKADFSVDRSEGAKEELESLFLGDLKRADAQRSLQRQWRAASMNLPVFVTVRGPS